MIAIRWRRNLIRRALLALEQGKQEFKAAKSPLARARARDDFNTAQKLFAAIRDRQFPRWARWSAAQ